MNSKSQKDEMQLKSNAPQREAWGGSSGICWVAHVCLPGGSPYLGCCTDFHTPLREEPHTHRYLFSSGQQGTGGVLREGPVREAEVRGQGKVCGDS